MFGDTVYDGWQETKLEEYLILVERIREAYDISGSAAINLYSIHAKLTQEEVI